MNKQKTELFLLYVEFLYVFFEEDRQFLQSAQRHARNR